MLVSVVVPLFNEEAGLEGLAQDLEVLRRSVESLGHKVEVIFVDDGSTDGTSWTLALLYQTRPRGNTRVVAHRKNRGFGAALRSGIAESRGAVVLCYDGDRPYPPEDAALLVEAVQGPEDADCATVSPWGSGGCADGIPAHRRLLSRGASRLYRWVLGSRAAGLTCFTASYRAYKADALRGIEFRSDDFLANAEILARLLRQGRRVIEIPARLRPRTTGSSSMRVVRTVRRHLGLLWKVATGSLEADWFEEKDSALVK